MTKNDEFCSRECYKLAFEPTNFGKNARKGEYTARDGRTMRFDSSLELRRMRELDFSRNVRSWERCEDKISWIDENGGSHLYHPDFSIIEMDGKKVVEEVKGYYDAHSKMKIDAARKHYAGTDTVYRVLFADDFKDNLEVHLETYQNEHGFFSRPSFYYVWMSLAIMLEQRSTCLRNKVGAVFTDDKMHRALCLGYNGNYSDGPNQCDSLEPGNCGCAHAEVNALSKASENLKGSTLFSTVAPCTVCAKLLLNKGVRRVIYRRAYRDVMGISLLRKNGVEAFKYDDFIENQLDISYEDGEETDVSQASSASFEETGGQ
jgi:dCMP deaminase